MKTVTLLQHLVDDYTRFVKELPEDHSAAIAYLVNNHSDDGLCHLLLKVYHDYPHTTLSAQSYWINRHKSTGQYWTHPPSRYSVHSSKLQALQYRLNILKAELAHHKKWGWFARFFKPTVVGN